MLAEKAQRVRPVTRVNDIPKGGDPAAEASSICREDVYKRQPVDLEARRRAGGSWGNFAAAGRHHAGQQNDGGCGTGGTAPGLSLIHI